ncbi:MAG: hypothetical protein PWQ55_2511 [Chloroflexota bacterium]|nr:hypothetical protein [Chloroflexota bacterium]
MTWIGECVFYEYACPVSFRPKGEISDGLIMMLTGRDPSSKRMLRERSLRELGMTWIGGMRGLRMDLSSVISTEGRNLGWINNNADRPRSFLQEDAARTLTSFTQDDTVRGSCHSDRRECDLFWKFQQGCSIPTQECVGFMRRQKKQVERCAQPVGYSLNNPFISWP